MKKPPSVRREEAMLKEMARMWVFGQVPINEKNEVTPVAADSLEEALKEMASRGYLLTQVEERIFQSEDEGVITRWKLYLGADGLEELALDIKNVAIAHGNVFRKPR